MDIEDLIRAVNGCHGKSYPAGSGYTNDDKDGNPIPIMALCLSNTAIKDCGFENAIGMQKYRICRDVFFALGKNPRIDTIKIGGNDTPLTKYAELWIKLEAEAQQSLAGYFGSCKAKYDFASVLCFNVVTQSRAVGHTDNKSHSLPSFKKGSEAMSLACTSKLMSIASMLSRKTLEKRKENRTKVHGRNAQNTTMEHVAAVQAAPRSNMRKKVAKKQQQKAPVKEKNGPPKRTNRDAIKAFSPLLTKVRKTLENISKSGTPVQRKIADLMYNCFAAANTDKKFKDLKSLCHTIVTHVYGACFHDMETEKFCRKVENTGLTPEYLCAHLADCPKWVESRHNWYISGQLISEMPEIVPKEGGTWDNLARLELKVYSDAFGKQARSQRAAQPRQPIIRQPKVYVRKTFSTVTYTPLPVAKAPKRVAAGAKATAKPPVPNRGKGKGKGNKETTAAAADDDDVEAPVKTVQSYASAKNKLSRALNDATKFSFGGLDAVFNVQKNNAAHIQLLEAGTVPVDNAGAGVQQAVARPEAGGGQAVMETA